MKRKILTCRRGLGTVTAVFMLLLMFAAITAVIGVYFNYNLNVQEQVKFEKERSQEKILFSKMELDDTMTNISNITVTNAGTIEVRIRALYVEKNGTTTLISDPSTYMDTHIAPAKSLAIKVQPTTRFEDANIIAATERGVKTLEYEPQLLFRLDNSQVSSSEVTIGPILLKFTDFSWKSTNPGDTWHPGWIIPRNTQCTWRLTVKNVDNRTASIILNNYTSFNVQTADGQRVVKNWYLGASSTELVFNKTASVIYMYTSWNSNAIESIYPNGPTSCKVFLTCYGVFRWADGKPDTPYAQTIPFEAIYVT